MRTENLNRDQQLIEDLLKSNELISTILSSTKHLMIATDPKGKVIYFNPASEEQLGYDSSEVVNEHTPALWHDKGEVIERSGELTEELGERIEPGFDVFVVKPNRDGKETREWTFARKDKTTFPASLTVTCLRNKKGQITGYLGVIEDITERKKAEAEREELIEKLMDSNEELEKFAYVCSHDLQEPLRMVTSFAQKLEMHLEDSLKRDEQGSKYLKFMLEGAARAHDLITDILNYSSIDRDTQKPENVNTMDLIDLIRDNMQLNLQENGGKITHDKLPNVIGNRTQLYQIFQNLINNGIKYQKPGHKPHSHISAKDKGEYWEFSVKDNGIGIEERHLKKIFDVFGRLHSKSEYSGTGIGLSICKKAVERHGGKIWVESKPDWGSTFYFTITKYNEE